MFEPLRIRAYIQTPVISDQFLPLDSILYYHVVRERFGEQDCSMPGESTIRDDTGIRLPFARENEGNHDWFYHCSFAQWAPDMREDQSAYCKRFDLKLAHLIDFQGKTGKILLSGGRFKNYYIKIYYRAATWVEWYALGEQAEIARLLPFVTHLGKKSAQGWGAVLRWEMEPVAFDWSIRGQGGSLMRAVPLESGTFIYGIRPCYWEPIHQLPCEMPV